jgi:large subunit ribosomal protein L25
MSGQDIALSLQERTVQGKAVRQLRRDGMIPAVIHDHGQPSKIVMASYTDIMKVYQEAGKHHPLALSLGSETYTALIKDVDFDPKKHLVRHVVFNAIRQDEKVEAEIPIHLFGDIPAEKMSLMVITDLDTVEIEALPKNLPDELKVDASTLAEVGDKLHVSDLQLPEGVVVLAEPEAVIAHVEMPRDQVAEANAAAEEMAAEKAEKEGAEAEEAPVEGETAEGGEESAPSSEEK